MAESRPADSSGNSPEALASPQMEDVTADFFPRPKPTFCRLESGDVVGDSIARAPGDCSPVDSVDGVDEFEFEVEAPEEQPEYHSQGGVDRFVSTDSGQRPTVRINSTPTRSRSSWSWNMRSRITQSGTFFGGRSSRTTESSLNTSRNSREGFAKGSVSSVYDDDGTHEAEDFGEKASGTPRSGPRLLKKSRSIMFDVRERIGQLQDIDVQVGPTGRRTGVRIAEGQVDRTKPRFSTGGNTQRGPLDLEAVLAVADQRRRRIPICCRITLSCTVIFSVAVSALLAGATVLLVFFWYIRRIQDESLASDALAWLTENSSSPLSPVTRARIHLELEELAQRQAEIVKTARFAGWLVFLIVFVFSILLAYFIGGLVWRPVKRFKRAMGHLSCLDFVAAKDLGEAHGLWDSEQAIGCCRLTTVEDLNRSFRQIYRAVEVFTRFVPEAVVRNVIQGNERATRLHVSRRIVTIMFSDIADFTTISEVLCERDLVFMLTRYLSVMTCIVELFEGVVAEILGDGILAYWNAVTDVSDHAHKACISALAQQQALAQLNEELEALELPKLSIRVGLHTGSVLAGNIGTEMKMKFGCIGDPVNTASRLEGLCKFWGINTVCSVDTFSSLPQPNGIFCRKLDLVQVKGKNLPLLIYEIIAIDRSVAESHVRGDSMPFADETGDGKEKEVCPLDSNRSSDLMCGPTSSGETMISQSPSQVASSAMQHSARMLASADAPIWHDLGQQSKPKKKVDKKNGSNHSFGTRSDAGKKSNGEYSHLGTNSIHSIGSSFASNSLAPEMSFLKAYGNNEDDFVTEDIRQCTYFYQRALDAFQGAHFAEARKEVEAALRAKPSDNPSQHLLQRIAYYVSDTGEAINALSAEEVATWTGVNCMTQK